MQSHLKVQQRCSVFCKSDCTHALNKGVRKSEVTSGLSLMMAEKVEDLLKKVKPGKVMVVGGVTKNSVVMNFLRENISGLPVKNIAALPIVTSKESSTEKIFEKILETRFLPPVEMTRELFHKQLLIILKMKRQLFIFLKKHLTLKRWVLHFTDLNMK